MEEQKQLGRVKRILPSEPMIDPGELAEKAYQDIAQIFAKNITQAYKETGDYLFENFFDSDIERVRKKDPISKESFHQLTLKFQDRGKGAPSKTLLYDSLALLVQKHDLEGFQTFGKLGTSQQLALLPVKNIEQKKKIITKAVEENLSVRQLKERISKIRAKGKRKKPAKTYQNELKGLKKELEKRLAGIKKLPEKREGKVNFNEIEEAIAGMIAMVDELIGGFEK